jgi:hypothetical protein
MHALPNRDVRLWISLAPQKTPGAERRPPAFHQWNDDFALSEEARVQ